MIGEIWNIWLPFGYSACETFSCVLGNLFYGAGSGTTVELALEAVATRRPQRQQLPLFCEVSRKLRC